MIAASSSLRSQSLILEAVERHTSLARKSLEWVQTISSPTLDDRDTFLKL